MNEVQEEINDAFFLIVVMRNNQGKHKHRDFVETCLYLIQYTCQ